MLLLTVVDHGPVGRLRHVSQPQLSLHPVEKVGLAGRDGEALVRHDVGDGDAARVQKDGQVAALASLHLVEQKY